MLPDCALQPLLPQYGSVGALPDCVMGQLLVERHVVFGKRIVPDIFLKVCRLVSVNEIDRFEDGAVRQLLLQRRIS